ncbi:hypothetical protein JCM19379_03440 [Methyloparacoccus murrellii]
MGIRADMDTAGLLDDRGARRNCPPAGSWNGLADLGRSVGRMAIVYVAGRGGTEAWRVGDAGGRLQAAAAWLVRASRLRPRRPDHGSAVAMGSPIRQFQPHRSHFSRVLASHRAQASIRPR